MVADMQPYTGEDLLNEVFDVMKCRVPKLQPDDPYRERLMTLIPQLAAALGRARGGSSAASREHPRRAGP